MKYIVAQNTKYLLVVYLASSQCLSWIMPTIMVTAPCQIIMPKESIFHHLELAHTLNTPHKNVPIRYKASEPLPQTYDAPTLPMNKIKYSHTVTGGGQLLMSDTITKKFW